MQPSANPWSNPRVLLTFALIFLCGALVGAIAVTVTTETTTLTQTPSPAGIGAAMTLANLTSELDLDVDQQERLRKVLDDYFQYYYALHDQLDEVKASGQEKILEILSPEQREKFRLMVDKVRTEAE